MYLGEIVEQAPAQRLYSQPAHPYTRALIDAVPRPDSGHRGHRAPLTGEGPVAGRSAERLPLPHPLSARQGDLS